MIPSRILPRAQSRDSLLGAWLAALARVQLTSERRQTRVRGKWGWNKFWPHFLVLRPPSVESIISDQASLSSHSWTREKGHGWLSISRVRRTKQLISAPRATSLEKFISSFSFFLLLGANRPTGRHFFYWFDRCWKSPCVLICPLFLKFSRTWILLQNIVSNIVRIIKSAGKFCFLLCLYRHASFCRTTPMT